MTDTNTQIAGTVEGINDSASTTTNTVIRGKAGKGDATLFLSTNVMLLSNYA